MPRNLIVRVGIDASGYTRGLSKLKQDTRTASEAMAKETAAVGLSQKVAKAQPGTTVNDRVGSMLQAGGAKLITDVDVNNIAEARRQMEDLAAVQTKLEAKGLHPGRLRARTQRNTGRSRECTKPFPRAYGSMTLLCRHRLLPKGRRRTQP